MTPAKKATPKLADLLSEKPPVTDVVELEPDSDESYDVSDEDVDSGAVSLIDPSENPVHTWEEDPDQNLARVQKDAVVSGKPSEHATVTTVVTETIYADVNENDDKGRKV